MCDAKKSVKIYPLHLLLPTRVTRYGIYEWALMFCLTTESNNLRSTIATAVDSTKL